MGKRLYVGNLPYDVDEAALRAVFAADGRRVERVHIVLDRETQRPRGFAFVEMGTDAEAQQAMATLSGTMFGSRQLRITEAEDRRPAGGPPRPGGGGGGGYGGPPRGPGPGGPSRGPGPGGPGGGGYGGGGGAPRSDTDTANRFGPDAKPRRDRDDHRGKAKPRRPEGEGSDDDAFGGRRGSRWLDDDEE